MENKKVHYKMYKSGKLWVTVAISTISLGLAAWSSNLNVKAASTDSPNVTIMKADNNDKHEQQSNAAYCFTI